MSHDSNHHDVDFLGDNRKERKAARKLASRKDRSKFKKTNLEKRERHLKEKAEVKLSKKSLKKGRVLAIVPEGILIESDHEEFLCVLGGVLKKEYSRAKNLIAVGDFVLFEQDKKMIAAIEERYSVLSRQDHLRRRQKQLLAANIDQVLITVSVVMPPLKPPLIDRYIIASYKGNMSPVIVVNKIDLLPSDLAEKKLFEDLTATYNALGIPWIGVSVITGEGLKELKTLMTQKASVFSGQSGVGKSSLINAMTGLDLSIGDLAKKTLKGSHTTSSAQLIRLPFGGWCIDTPGIRSLGVWELNREDLDHYFPEIYSLGRACKFPNCTHSHEPDCKVRQAVLEGTLSQLRYESFVKLLYEIKNQ